MKGGAGSHRSECCSGSPCNSHRNYHGGGGGGGHLRHFSPDYIRRDIIRNRDVSGGASGGGSAGNGGSGQISAAGNQCSGHGTFSVQEGSCTCDAGSYGVSCLYQCDASITCLGHGRCSASGGCDCDAGYVGYRCEHKCDAARDCHGNGRCSVTGKCVCDPCYSGDDCRYECSGNGTCIGGKCKCDPCYIGTHCHSLCSGHGTCNNGTCYCGSKWKGDYCEVPKCPNDCSGNGICNSALLTCFCNPGWRGLDCSELDCPGEPDCHNRGTCSSINGTVMCVNCSVGWMGPACNDPCVNGVQEPMDSGFCKCNPCWAGKGCDALCMGRGTCSDNGICKCDPLQGWRGDVCQIPGCPGVGKDCTGNGDCNSATHECICYPGWAGLGCDIPDCPGAPNCNNRGYCNASVTPPQCQNCSRGWMGAACADPCTFGEQTPMDSGQCVCWPGYTGKDTNIGWFVNIACS